MSWFKFVLFIGFAILVIGGALFITGTVQNFVDTQLFGAKYCFESKYQQDIELAFRDTSISFTKEEGDSVCFRTNDFSKVTALNQQIQDRKYKEKLAEIESNERVTTLAIIIGAIVFVIVVISYFASRSNNSYGGIF